MSKTPKLRFKEFSGDWESNKLKELCSDFIVPMRDKPQVFDGNIPWCRIEDIEGKYLNGTKSNQYVSKETVDNMNLKVNPTGTLICSCSAAIGNNAITTTPLITNQTFIGLVCENVNNEYLYYLMGTQKRNLEKIAGGTTIPYISRKKFEEFNVIVPTIKEQEKIASFFSLIDDKISLQGEKVEALKDYKKGMMQKIFSRELRFKDDEGRDYPEWEEKKLGDIANLTSSKRVFASDYVDEGIPFYRGKEITELKQNKKPNDILYITQEKYDDIKNNFGIPVKGDLLLTAVGTLGNSYVIKDDNPFYFKDGNLIWFKDIKEDVNFLNFILTSEKGQKKIIDSAIGSTQKALTIVELNKLKYEFPSLKEQRKIAKFLNGLESKVMKEQEKLDFLNEYKKGLLQQMFV